MPKILISISAAIVTLVALILIAPNFIDWTPYRQTFAAAMSVATGRQVDIGGEMAFALLPRPAFNATNVRIDAADQGNAISIERLSARLAFIPLFSGRLKFDSLVLIRPTVEIMRHVDGSFELPMALGGSTADADLEDALFDLEVDRIGITQGSVILRDESSTASWTATGMDLAFTAQSETGPFALTGSLAAQGIPVVVDLIIGRSSDGAPRQMNAALRLLEAEATVTFNGAITSIGYAVELRGAVNVSGSSASAVLAAFGLVDASTPMPAVAMQPFIIDSILRFSAGGADLIDLNLNVGGTQARGTALWQLSDQKKVLVKLEVGVADLETWRFTTAATGTGTPSNAPSVKDTVLFTLPQDLIADIDIRAPALSLRGAMLRDAVFNAKLSNGLLTVSEAAITLPWASQASFNGEVREVGNLPTFEGDAEFSTQNLRALTSWLGMPDPKEVPSGRLTSLSIAMALQGTPQRFTLSDLRGTLDASGIVGSVNVARGQRLALGIDLNIDSFNLDAYGTLFGEGSLLNWMAPRQELGGSASAYGITPVFASLGWLTKFDTELRLQINSLIGGGFTNGRVGIDLGLAGGIVKLRSLALENLAGASAWISGDVTGFGTTPKLDQVQFDLSSESLSRLGRAFGFDVPEFMLGLTPVTFTGVVNGGLVQADLSGALQAGGLVLQIKGQLMALDRMPHYSFDIEGAHNSLVDLARDLNLGLHSSNTGAMTLVGRIDGNASMAKIESLKVNFGDNAAIVNGILDRTQDPPLFTADVAALVFDFDRLWPRDPTLHYAVAAGYANESSGSLWSQDALDWSFLSQWNGHVRLAGSLASVRGFRAEEFTFQLTLNNGVLELSEWTGQVIGGDAQVALRLAASPEPQAQGQIAIKGADLEHFAALFSSTARPVGKADLVAGFRAHGGSWRNMIESLSGSGSLSMRSSGLGESPLPGPLAPLMAVKHAEILAQESNRTGEITAQTRFTAEGGKMKLDEAVVESPSYTGNMSGIVDFVNWQVDLSGSLRSLGTSTLNLGGSQFLLPPVLPVVIKGPLDLPNVILQVSDGAP